MRRFVHGDHPVIGWLGRRRGNLVQLSGCEFELPTPEVSDAIFSRFVLGRYERPELEAIGAHLPAELPLIELGGGLGVLSCIANRRLRTPEGHWVVEANPELVPIIEKQRALNHCSFSVIHAALSYVQPARIYINRARVTATSAQRSRGELLEVPAVTLRQLLEERGLFECSLMVDIEGAELEMVETEADVLRAHVRLLMMELHPDVYGHEGAQRVREALERVGFELVSDAPPVIVMERPARTAANRTA